MEMKAIGETRTRVAMKKEGGEAEMVKKRIRRREAVGCPPDKIRPT
jgi:hypothetical protein